MDNITIPKATVENFTKTFIDSLEMGVAIAGPADMTTDYCLAKAVIDTTGHGSEICHIVANKIGLRLNAKPCKVMCEKSIGADIGEATILGSTREAYPGLIIVGMAANAVFSSHRMEAIFGGMFLYRRKGSLSHQRTDKLTKFRSILTTDEHDTKVKI